MVAKHEARFPNPGSVIDEDLKLASLEGFEKKRWHFQGIGPFVDGDLEDRAFYDAYWSGLLCMDKNCFYARAMLRKVWLSVNVRQMQEIGGASGREVGSVGVKVFIEAECERLVYQKNYAWEGAVDEALRSPMLEVQCRYGGE